MPTSSVIYPPAGVNNISGCHGAVVKPSRELAARVIQTWVRRHWDRRYAHRLLLLLHVMAASRAPGHRLSEGSMCQLVSPTEGPTALSSSYTTRDMAPDTDDYFGRMYETVVKYESALQLENYTRRLLADEFCASSEVARGASHATRHILRQQHPLLRRVSLSADALHSVAKDCSRARHNSISATTVTLEKLRSYLTPELFSWWRAGQRSPSACVPYAAPTPPPIHNAARDFGLNHPLPLCTNPGGARMDEVLESGGLEAVWMEVGGDEIDDETAMNVAYTTERDAVKKDAFLTAQRTTLAGCPDPFATRDGDGAAGVLREDASSTCLPEGDDIHLVVQPVLGGVARRRFSDMHHPLAKRPTTVEEVIHLREGTTEAPMCAVCELCGVVANLQNTADTVLETQEEDELHPCSACHALVHTSCAFPCDTADIFYCSRYCSSGGNRA